MSKNIKGVLGEQYGKVGPVVARKFREENVYSAYQKNVANPRTDAQETHRARFKAMSELAHNIACGAIFGFRTAAKGTNLSPRNLFQKTNWKCISATGHGTHNIDYTGMAVSKGGLSNIHPDIPEFDVPMQVKIDFEENGIPCQRTKNDKAYIYVYSPDAKQGILSEPIEIADGTGRVKVPSHWNGMKVHVWMFCRNEGPEVPEFGIQAGECSPSAYCGSGNIS